MTILCNCDRQYDFGDIDCEKEQERRLKKALMDCNGIKFVHNECVAYQRNPKEVWTRAGFDASL